MKRLATALALMTGPALGHTGTEPHLHEAQAFWLTAAVFVLALGMTLLALLRRARAAA